MLSLLSPVQQTHTTQRCHTVSLRRIPDRRAPDVLIICPSTHSDARKLSTNTRTSPLRGIIIAKLQSRHTVARRRSGQQHSLNAISNSYLSVPTHASGRHTPAACFVLNRRRPATKKLRIVLLETTTIVFEPLDFLPFQPLKSRHFSALSVASAQCDDSTSSCNGFWTASCRKWGETHLKSAFVRCLSLRPATF